MKRIFLIMLTAILTQQLYADEYLPFVLKAIKSNLKLPVKLNYGKIYKIQIENNEKLILYIDTTTSVKFKKNKICSLPLFQDILKENGEIEYKLKGKTAGDYLFNSSICNSSKSSTR